MKTGDSIESNFNRILIIDLARLGDVTLASPVIANLRINHPDAQIEFIVSKGSHATVANNPKLNSVLIFEKPGSLFSQIKYLIDFSRNLRAKKFDVAFILHRSITSALLAWMSGIRVRVGHDTQGRKFFLTHSVKLDKSQHRLDNNLRLLEAVGENILTRKPEYFPADTQNKILEQVRQFKDGKPLIVINPNGVWDTKRWEPEKFAQLSKMLIEKMYARIIVIGGKGDEERGKTVSGKNPMIMDLTAKTSVDDLYRIMKESDLVITNDSGPMHIAAAANARIIAIFGPTNPQRCGPKSDNNMIETGDADCLCCYYKTCSTMKCMKSLTVDKVYEESLKLLKP